MKATDTAIHEEIRYYHWFAVIVYPVQCYWQFHSGLLVGLLMLSLVSSMLGLQLSAPDPLRVATQLTYLLESQGSLLRT